ncbi:hypothetical protein ZOSMA_56G00570 [Zostera marina]|uniref:DOMON domain-containing protein n=1 Tax=Zostera marina TaxID=29655 RepID=A0A0K9NVM9_ZOSMR|nr:hypothetical protein ZOSMA_56G00570 [Zostera marina]
MAGLSYYLSFLLATVVFSSVCCVGDRCGKPTLPASRTFVNCTDLPTLGATLHWTYDPVTANLSVGFSASNPDGWVAWGINPTKLAMEGTQALVAFRNATNMVMTPNTYNISTDKPTPGRIAYNVTDLASEIDSENVTMIFGSMILPVGTVNINSIWQSGTVVDNEISSHPLKPANKKATMILRLTQTTDKGNNTGTPPGKSAGNELHLGVVLSTLFFLGLCCLI